MEGRAGEGQPRDVSAGWTISEKLDVDTDCARGGWLDVTQHFKTVMLLCCLLRPVWPREGSYLRVLPRTRPISHPSPCRLVTGSIRLQRRLAGDALLRTCHGRGLRAAFSVLQSGSRKCGTACAGPEQLKCRWLAQHCYPALLYSTFVRRDGLHDNQLPVQLIKCWKAGVATSYDASLEDVVRPMLHHVQLGKRWRGCARFLRSFGRCLAQPSH
jgi:hypothetical protein